ncbi:hypothetical protein CES85_1780 [Ochrobactrum quorumnocens]|uniref:Uncharacterized protein n=1 Tax=Ochrobactrum quorumnocens TaxID=271865 RepID=A0A248UEI4_9HYPH|nr:hypothetical protein CES85_1780 [[Ochrobactrum] quorumnocens]
MRDDCRNFVALHFCILSRNVPCDWRSRENSNFYVSDLAKSCSLAKHEDVARRAHDFLSPRKDSSSSRCFPILCYLGIGYSLFREAPA